MRGAAYTVVSICAALNSPVSPALAQEAVTLHPGMRVRVNAPAQLPQPAIGLLVADERTALIVQTAKGMLAVRREAIQKLEISERRSSKRKGALIGGAVGSAVVLALLASLCSSDWGCEGIDADRTAAVFGVVGGLGAAIGAAIAPGERWVDLRAAAVCCREQGEARGLRFGLSVRF